MSRPLVLLDVDGVLADFIGGVLEWFWTCTGVVIPREAITSWDITSTLEKYWPGQRDQCKTFYHDEVQQPGFCFNLSVLHGAVAGVSQLREVADVHIVTSPWDSSRHWTYERNKWLQKHFKLPPSAVTHTHRKTLLGGEGVILVDDKPSTIQEYNTQYGSGGYLWDTSHNKSVDIHSRVHGWDDLLRTVHEEKYLCTGT